MRTIHSREFRGGRGDVTLLLSILDVARKLKSLMVHSHPTMPRTLKRSNDEEFPSLESVACLWNELEQFTLSEFRGGRGDVTLLLSILYVARKLKTLLVHSHPTMPRAPKEAMMRSSPR